MSKCMALVLTIAVSVIAMQFRLSTPATLLIMMASLGKAPKTSEAKCFFYSRCSRKKIFTPAEL